MRVIFFILFLLAIIDGFYISSLAVSVMHQQLYYTAFLIGAVFLVGAGILDGLIKLEKNLKKDSSENREEL